ncbi:MAG: SRPBCC family protein [Actinomycetota bacterium]
MHTAFDTTTRFDHRIDHVWTALTDWDRLGDWMPGVTSASGPDEPADGDELALTMQRGDRVSVLTEWRPTTTMAFRSTTGPVAAEYRYELTRVDETTTDVRITGRCAVRGPMRLAAPLIRRTLRTTDGDQLARLRDLMDGRRSR